MSTIVGFTGARHGMSLMQREAVLALLVELNPTEFHHGDCVGADLDAHGLVRDHLPGCRVVAHPPLDARLRAHCDADEERPALPYLVRDQHIVDAGVGPGSRKVMIAAPYQATEQSRGGTWATVRMTRKAGQPLAIVTRSGEVRKERWKGV